VFWWFERRGQYLRYEARQIPGGYELRIVEPDGTERVEQYEASEQLTARQIEFERQLATDGWAGPHGWNL
jgi:hypothetical protein